MSLEERVAASFISRYFELLMTDAKQLASFYLPKAQFSHEGKTSSIIGNENIAKALARLYPQANHGRVSIKDMQIKATEAAAGRFAVSIGGTYFRRGASEGDEFRHVVELQEHQGSNGVYGIYADTRTVQRPQMMSTWAMETPPMFAKAGNESAIPEIVQPPASEPAVPVVVATTVAAKQPTPKVSPKTSPALKPAAEPVVEVAAPVETSDTPAVVEAESAPAAPKAPASFLDMARARAGKPVQSTPVARVEAKTEETKAKEEAERLAKEEAAKKEKESAGNDRKKGNKGSKKESDESKAEKSAKAAGGTSTAAAATAPAGAAVAAAPAAATNDKRRQGGDKVISHSVVFYDVIVKGLPKTATEKSVEEMISFLGPVKKINVKSQADKKDSSITRTFAFVLFDHEAIVAAGGNVSTVIQRVTKEGTQKFTSQRIQIDEVREKFTQEDPRAEKAE
ncbi:RNA-binding protein, putative [Bodo saltans]|uniref:RNA-binding protein, putative n=1 Tax=Bodo saltans TaxID=75058 RepID=B6DTE9_BODSA|nr:hypothetical protein [Bodo saltans]CUG88464.1 RNA-binding protein, putative [Bodo saltans]|eukprot:CUG88464.1 RNA-binding protein, putative [Bodo saltans]